MYFFSSYFLNASQGTASTCPVKLFSHLYCPGCGATRAIAYFFRGELWKSLCANPIILYGVAVFVYYYIKVTVCFIYKSILKKQREFDFEYSLISLFLAAALVVLFAVIRDVLLVKFGYDYLGELTEYWN